MTNQFASPSRKRVFNMSREKKKGTSGNAKAFVTRAKCLKKLQLSLPEFRRLCILKGIYPREPRKKLEGTDKTYYLRKDIDFLAHERLLSTLRATNAHKKKVVKAVATKRIDILKRLALKVPKARLDHLVVERYPRFEDAIRELDDPLCIVALFANLPADHKVGIAPQRVAKCQRLLNEFHHFVASTNALTRVFVSIKGYYFQAHLAGENVTWITPHRFSQVLPEDVDYSVMLTFLELYECIMSFVNFRLFTSCNLSYPPKISRTGAEKALQLAAIEVEKISPKTQTSEKKDIWKDDEAPTKVSDQAVKAAEEALVAGDEEESDDEADGDGVEGEHGEGSKDDDDSNNDAAQNAVFAGKSFVLGREVPYNELEFALKACGAVKVTREVDLSEGEDRLKPYTHWIIDRPKVVGKQDMSLEYVQPQYVFDSINAAVLLPTTLYAPGQNLPPHLSPFVTAKDDGGYQPWFKEVLDRVKAGDTSVVAEAAAAVYAEGAAREKKEREAKMQGKEMPPGDTNAAKESGKKIAKKPRSDTAPVEESDEEDESSSDDEDMGDGSDTNTAGNGIEGSLEKDGLVREGSDSEMEQDSNASEEEEGSEEESDEEDDDEGEEEQVEKVKKAKLEKEGKEMATLMLSRKKMREYKRVKRDEQRSSAKRDKLTAKRKKLEEARAEVLSDGPKKRRKK